MIPQITLNILLIAMFIFVGLGIISGTLLAAKTSTTPLILNNYIYTQFELNVIDEINRYRKQNNLPPLEIHNHLSNITQHHTMQMVIDKAQSHNGLVIRKQTITQALQAKDVQEVLSRYQNTSEGIVGLWKMDDHYNAILKKDLNYIGVSIIEDGKQRPYCTAILVKL